jgi:hypothetical protein
MQESHELFPICSVVLVIGSDVSRRGLPGREYSPATIANVQGLEKWARDTSKFDAPERAPKFR